MKAGKVAKLPFKIVGWVVLSILVIFIGVNIYLCTAGFPDWAKKQVVDIMKKTLKRQVKIEKVSFCLLKGIVIKNVQIADKGKRLKAKKEDNNEKNLFLSCDAFVVNYDLSQIFKKKVKIEKLIIEKPKIYIKRFKRGKETVFNFSDMLPPVPKKQPKEVKKAEAEAAPAKPAFSIFSAKSAFAAKPAKKLDKKSLPPIELQVNKFGLEKALIQVIDTATPRFKEVYELKDVTFLIENINLTQNSEMKITIGFGVSVTELKDGKKTDKDINLEAEALGKVVVFDKKGVMNPSGQFNLALRNGKLTGMQAYDELRNQAQDLNKSVNKIQKDILKKIGQLKQLNKLGIKGDKLASQAGKIDTSFIEGSLEFDFLKKTLEFDKIETVVKIKDGRFITEDLVIDLDDAVIKGGGYTDMDQNVKYDMLMLLAKKYNKNEITKAIANKDGKPEVPVKVRGTTSDTKVTIDENAITKKVKARLMKKIPGMKDVEGGLKKQAEAAVKAKLDEAKKKAEAEAKARLEAEKKKQEEAAKKKAAEEAKKIVPKSVKKFVPKF